MSGEKIEDRIVIVPTAEKNDEIFEAGEKTKKCFAAVVHKLKKADEFFDNKSIVNTMLGILASFAAGIFLGLLTSKTFRRLGYALLTLSGIGIMFFSYKKFFED